MIRDRVADGDTVIAIPESHAIKKALGIFVGELQIPVFAAVGGLVNARLIALGPALSRYARSALKASTSRKFPEISAPGTCAACQDFSAIGCPQIGSVSAAGPGDVVGQYTSTPRRFSLVLDFSGMGFCERSEVASNRTTHKRRCMRRSCQK